MTAPADGRWFLLRSGALAPAMNMAWDEALLEATTCTRQPILRFYAWSEPAATFGYFQRYKDVERTICFRPLVRRPTGGGIVSHDRDWTYALVIPAQHPWYGIAAEVTYVRLHRWLQMSFRLLGIITTLALLDKDGAGQCFAGATRHDLLFCGRKIAGAALRRTRDGLLVQGSVQPPPCAPPKCDWESAMQITATRHGGVEWETLAPDNNVAARAQQLAEQKYSMAAYNQRR